MWGPPIEKLLKRLLECLRILWLDDNAQAGSTNDLTNVPDIRSDDRLSSGCRSLEHSAGPEEGTPVG